MKILVLCGLNNASVRARLTPLVMQDEVERILVIRDQPGPEMEKVAYACAPAWARGNMLRYVLKPFLCLWTVARFSPDAIVGVFLVPHGLIAILLGKLTGVPSVVSLIGADLDEYLTHRNTVLRGVLCFLLSRATVVTTTGIRSAKELSQLGVSRPRVTPLPNAIDTDVFSVNSSLERDIDLIFVARFVLGKRPCLFLSLVAEVKKRRGRVRALMVGDGPELGASRECAARLGLMDDVVFLGHVEDVATPLLRSRLFVLPTLAEGLPYSLVEAMACGVPCVTGDVGDTRDLVEHDVNGILHSDFADVDATAQILVELLDDDARCAQIASNALTSVQLGFTMASAAVVWKDVLENLSGGASPEDTV
jgi:glycosyltransferase involved in cell wall biosynthesis